MVSNEKTAPTDVDRQWFIVGRWQEYEGETRANLLRIIGIAAFYIVELANYHGVRLGVFEMPRVVEKPFHQSVTALAVAWTLMSLVILYCLSHRIFPAVLKFVSTACDVALLTAILVMADGPKSPLVVGYFLLIALSALRFNLPLIWLATAGSMAGYLVLLGNAKWFDESVRVPRYHQIIFLLALGLSGIVLGQVIRRVRSLAKDYAARVESNRGAPS
ncbi:MAG: hypothetical protein H8E44_11535 [Planctomycetes bacterium]|nr:hypothetical protein [Planctomycetota bacterium]MBL7038533.1 hypothetical protein [Pirellulaceae bacterium]